MKLTDEKLYELCREYGARARLWRQKFIGLLPEVNRRHLYEKKGFSSIFEFAAKLCGLSAEQVRLALNLEKRFEKQPILKKMLENGEASINKLTRIASIATPENEEELAAKIKVLPIRALNTLVRDEKAATESATTENENGLSKPLFEDKSLYVQTLDFELSGNVKRELNELHSKGIDVNELLKKMLEKRRTEIAEEKEKIAETIQPTTSHYIQVRIKKILKEEYGTKCSIPTCNKPAKVIHHTQKFGLSHNHDPRFLVPFCEEHHAIAHSVDLKYHEVREQSLH